MNNTINSERNILQPKLKIQPQFTRIIIIALLFIFFGSFSLRHSFLYLLFWNLVILSIFFFYFVFKKSILLFDDYFIVIPSFKNNRIIKGHQLKYSCISAVKCHISSAPGANILTVSYTENNIHYNRRYEFSGTAPIEILKFLKSKNITLFIDDTNVLKMVDQD